mmetsp:Transcript_17255/g.52489  ORF Transcript_17255/g.52489 Transcript_17255/m.52489 type:complete len:249 (+) Transcript_17255:135-881(+)
MIAEKNASSRRALSSSRMVPTAEETTTRRVVISGGERRRLRGVVVVLGGGPRELEADAVVAVRVVEVGQVRRHLLDGRRHGRRSVGMLLREGRTLSFFELRFGRAQFGFELANARERRLQLVLLVGGPPLVEEASAARGLVGAEDQVVRVGEGRPALLEAIVRRREPVPFVLWYLQLQVRLVARRPHQLARPRVRRLHHQRHVVVALASRRRLFTSRRRRLFVVVATPQTPRLGLGALEEARRLRRHL